MENILNSPLTSILICVIGFEIGLWINRRTKIALFNPLLIAIGVVIVILKLLNIPLEVFKSGSSTINMFLGPATVVLAIPMYSQFQTLKENWLPILVGTSVGASVSMVSVYFMANWFGLDELMRASLLPKSVTTPIAMEISAQGGGIAGITVAAVVITGITGAVIAPALIKLFRIKNSVAAGLAIGTCSHAVGTSKAVQLGEIEGAMSGLAIGVAGIFTVIISLFV
ncbi:MAG: LrgB family protein [Cellulosilyticaceae bacterium]